MNYNKIMESKIKMYKMEVIMNCFSMNTKIYFEENALEHLETIAGQKVLLIVDPFVEESGMITMITEPLERGKKEYEIFKEVAPDAPIDKITQGVDKMLTYHPDVLVAVGGGSAIDSAKAIREFALKIESYGKIPLIAIPTTSGTGSEVTNISVVSDPGSKTKQPLSSESLTPNEAILAVQLVESVPAFITADTGMDVLTHALEALVSSKHSCFSDALAEKAIELCGTYLLRSYRNPKDKEAREQMHYASCLAGMAFQTSSLGLNHGMAHQLGGKFHIPHGRANAIILPYLIAYNIGTEDKETMRRYGKAAKILGLNCFNDTMAVRSLIQWVKGMMKEMNMPGTISEIEKVPECEYESAVWDMAESALKDACTMGNPRIPVKEEVVLLYQKLWK